MLQPGPVRLWAVQVRPESPCYVQAHAFPGLASSVVLEFRALNGLKLHMSVPWLPVQPVNLLSVSGTPRPSFRPVSIQVPSCPILAWLFSLVCNGLELHISVPRSPVQRVKLFAVPCPPLRVKKFIGRPFSLHVLAWL